ncbi:putative iron-regulated membrane protein [Pedobacter cryoconitis]|uniref:Putative iron-regulated membrane protein n=1 Tax=Pedobacter cryoconitis TaxID=188932 RepID=A0A7W9E132_9SPHI|nr:PepSY-associated TM helix domain-containing protein [Pedobacter cryoconitis]MBB5638558.1 putative iron-regulated membrane protein [Pedobacter cryoconitis]
MTLKKINAWLHLWLGIGSGLIVFIVSITGCIYVFEKEIRSLYQPWQFVQPQEKSFLLPTQLINSAKPQLGKLKPTSINYGQKSEAATVNSVNRKKGTSLVVYLNPYTAEILHIEKKSKKSNSDFFRFILNGHRTLWMGKTGSKIIGIGVLIFVFLLISGIILWWPKKWIKSIRDKSFKIKWDANFKRVNYDLHKVAGFYVFLILLLISLTGLVYSYKWYSKSLYWVTSGGKSLQAQPKALSDTTGNHKFQPENIDKIYSKLATTDQASGMFITLPSKASDALGFIVYLKAGAIYKADRYAFDQYTLKPITGNSPLLGKYKDASVADKIRRMNYDLHVGAVMGLPTKIIAFLASLISASLPITGFIVWYGKKFKKKKGKKPLVQEKMVLKKKNAPWELKKVSTAAMQEPVA